MTSDSTSKQPNSETAHYFPIKCTGLKSIYQEITSGLVKWMYRPTDPSSLAIARILYGLLMLGDILAERGGSEIDIRWGDPRDCRFPLFSFLKPLPLPYMGLLYGVMWFGALGITLGYKFKLSCTLFSLPYWYLFFLDKSFWNNHTYLYGLLSILFFFSSANKWCSLDAKFSQDVDGKVPYWNYFLVKFQVFLLYFYAGLKKIDFEWLSGYSMTNLGKHWVFDPFKLFLSTESIDLMVIHWVGFLLDLTIGFWLIHKRTRIFAIFFCSSFHLMNSRLFSIGMFPYIGLATLPLFCEADWPKTAMIKLKNLFAKNCITEDLGCQKLGEKSSSDKLEEFDSKVTWKKKAVVGLVLSYCGLQGFLPYSHFITKGYNNWTNGLYGYSWDMMVHSWDTILVVVKVVDNKSGREHFLDPRAWVQNERWSKQADMCVQYAHCLKSNILADYRREKKSGKKPTKDSITHFITSEDISIYVDVWCSLNGRFQQRMFDPTYDLLKANWSPFKPVEWLLPLLTQYNNLREVISTIQEDVYSWSNHSDVLFIADFPGLYLENFISEELVNVTLTVLEGEVTYEIEDSDYPPVKLPKGGSLMVETDVFHKIRTVSSVPSCFMYTYINKTSETMKKEDSVPVKTSKGMYSPFPLLEDTAYTLESFVKMFEIIGNSLLNVIYNVPMPRRTRLS